MLRESVGLKTLKTNVKLLQFTVPSKIYASLLGAFLLQAKAAST